MICENCKSGVPENEKFCPNCGKIMQKDIIKNQLNKKNNLIDKYNDMEKLEVNEEKYNFKYLFFFLALVGVVFFIVLLKLLGDKV